MENMDPESEVRSDFHFADIVGDQPRRAARDERGRRPAHRWIPTLLMSGENGTRKDALYKAVIALSRSIAGRTDLEVWSRASPNLFARSSVSIMSG